MPIAIPTPSTVPTYKTISGTKSKECLLCGTTVRTPDVHTKWHAAKKV